MLKRPPPARLVMIVHFNDMNDYPFVCRDLEKKYGKIDYETAPLRIDSNEKTQLNLSTKHPLRILKIISFKNLIARDAIVAIQTRILKMEKKYNKSGTTRINLRCGYVTGFSATGCSLSEDFHRIYLFNGIYAEVWYKFERMSFRPFDHTPLFMLQKSIVTAFNDIRLIYENK